MDGKTAVTEMPRLIVKPGKQGEKVMKAYCSHCKEKLFENTYSGMWEFQNKSEAWKEFTKACPKCGVKYKTKATNETKPIAWKKSANEWTAKGQNGEFYLWKQDRKSWRWSFRYYNEKYPRAENTGVAFLKEIAIRCCERHKEWK